MLSLIGKYLISEILIEKRVIFLISKLYQTHLLITKI